MRTIAGLLAVVALLLGGAGAHGAAAATPPAKLLARHAPVLVLHPQERFVPVPVDGFLADSDFLAKAPDGDWQPSPDAFPGASAATRLDQRTCRAIDGAAAVDCYAQAQAAHTAVPTVYGAVFRSKKRIALQYWLFYPYNLWSQTAQAGTVTQAHEGDWEKVTVLLDRAERPQVVGLSRHCSGVRRPWGKAPKQGAHPIVYVSLGSHANGFTTGTVAQETTCWPKEAVIVMKAFGVVAADVAARGPRVRPRVVPVTAAAPGWMTFRGTWGEDRYVTFPNNPPIAFGSGPRGPAFQALWRTPFATPLGWPVG